MCLHGLEESGQENDVLRSFRFCGKRDIPSLLNCSSISRGISPESRDAAKAGCSAIVDKTWSHSSFLKGVSLTLTVYVPDLDPWTLALTVPFPISRLTTCPFLA